MKIYIDNKIKDIISKKFNININNLENNLSLKNDLLADSLDILELIIELENNFNISISDKDIENFDKIEFIIDIVKKKLIYLNK